MMEVIQKKRNQEEGNGLVSEVSDVDLKGRSIFLSFHMTIFS